MTQIWVTFILDTPDHVVYKSWICVLQIYVLLRFIKCFIKLRISEVSLLYQILFLLVRVK